MKNASKSCDSLLLKCNLCCELRTPLAKPMPMVLSGPSSCYAQGSFILRVVLHCQFNFHSLTWSLLFSHIQQLYLRERCFQRMVLEGWRHGSVVTSTCCSYRGSQSGSQNPSGALWWSITPVIGDPTPSSGLHGTRHTDSAKTYIQAKHSHT